MSRADGEIYLHDTDLIDEVLDSPHYAKHVSHMTSEGLHGKGAIATELAYRDMQIESLQSQLERYRSKQQ